MTPSMPPLTFADLELAGLEMWLAGEVFGHRPGVGGVRPIIGW